MINDQEKIKIMQHFIDGGKIESREKYNGGEWNENYMPSWNWYGIEYRIKEEYTAEQKKVMDHFKNGGTIESRLLESEDVRWYIVNMPSWNWKTYDYRIKPEEKKKEKLYLFGYKIIGFNNFFIAKKLYSSKKDFICDRTNGHQITEIVTIKEVEN